MNVYYPAIKGTQGGQTFYSVQVPFAALSKSFVFDDQDLPIELRCQREINLARAKKFADYMKNNQTSFVTGAVIGTVNDEAVFIPLEGPFSNGDVGVLKLPATHKIVLCDGQHRQKGIEIALNENNSEFENNTLPIILYQAESVERKQQIFTEINSNTVKPSTSLSMTFDHRSNFISFVKSVTKELPKIANVIEWEKNTVSPKSLRLWPLVSFKTFICFLTRLTEKNFDEQITNEETRQIILNVVVTFIKGLDNLPLWQEVVSKKTNISEIRQDHIIAHAVFLESLGMYGAMLLQHFDSMGKVDWTLMENLRHVPTEKTAWVNKCVSPQLTIVKNQFGIKSTAAKICEITNTPMSEVLEQANAKI